MTKTIEFVSIAIENQTEKLNEFKREKLLYETLNKIEDWAIPYDDEIDYINSKIEDIEFNLEHMKQIKTELEAWEELNKTFEIGVEEQIDEIYIKGKNYYGSERTIWGHSKDGTLKVKKALEVE